MDETTTIAQEEQEVVDNIVRSFMRKMQWDHRWVEEDVRQDLFIFWLKKKRNGWSKPKEWKGAMGYCLLAHLKDLQAKVYAKKRYPGKPILSLDKMIEDGWEFSNGGDPPFRRKIEC